MTYLTLLNKKKISLAAVTTTSISLYPLAKREQPITSGSPSLVSSAPQMARCFPRATVISATSIPPPPKLIVPHRTCRFDASKSSLFGRKIHSPCGYQRRDAATPLLRARVSAAQRDYRKEKELELELNVSVCIEEGLPEDPEILVTLNSVYVYGCMLSTINVYIAAD